jgi:hypothetical protein
MGRKIPLLESAGRASDARRHRRMPDEYRTPCNPFEDAVWPSEDAVWPSEDAGQSDGTPGTAVSQLRTAGRQRMTSTNYAVHFVGSKETDNPPSDFRAFRAFRAGSSRSIPFLFLFIFKIKLVALEGEPALNALNALIFCQSSGTLRTRWSPPDLTAGRFGNVQLLEDVMQHPCGSWGMPCDISRMPYDPCRPLGDAMRPVADAMRQLGDVAQSDGISEY